MRTMKDESSMCVRTRWGNHWRPSSSGMNGGKGSGHIQRAYPNWWRHYAVQKNKRPRVSRTNCWVWQKDVPGAGGCDTQKWYRSWSMGRGTLILRSGECMIGTKKSCTKAHARKRLNEEDTWDQEFSGQSWQRAGSQYRAHSISVVVRYMYNESKTINDEETSGGRPCSGQRNTCLLFMISH